MIMIDNVIILVIVSCMEWNDIKWCEVGTAKSAKDSNDLVDLPSHRVPAPSSATRIIASYI